MQKIDLQSIDLDSLKSMKVAELRDIAGKIGIENPELIHKVQLRQRIQEIILEKRASEVKKSRGKIRNKTKEPAVTQEKQTPVQGSGYFKSEKRTIPSQIIYKRPERPGDTSHYFHNSTNQSGKNSRMTDSASNRPEADSFYSHIDGNAADSMGKTQEGSLSVQDPVVSGQDHEAAGTSTEVKYSPQDRPQVEGILDIAEGGFGFLRFRNFLTSDQDIYVSQKQIRRFHLKTGDRIKGITRRPNEGERFGSLLFVNTVNGDEPGVSIHRSNFEDLTPVFPDERILLEGNGNDLPMRMIDLFAPIGKGQRGLIVAPPKTGKTVLLKQVAKSIETSYPDVQVIVLLIDERPEEVTDMKRSIKGEVIYSTFDKPAEHHVKVAEMVIAHAHRLAEHKKDVVILLDSITRLARAYNMVVPSSGKTLSGGLDPGALHKPKKFFGSARKLEEGGSITILATALIETGSRMDDVIFEEFKGTGNMELHLDRKLSERRIFPAINVHKSGTRREDLLLEKEELEAVFKIRRALASQGVPEVTETIIDNIAHTKRNKDFINIINKTKVLS